MPSGGEVRRCDRLVKKTTKFDTGKLICFKGKFRSLSRSLAFTYAEVMSTLASFPYQVFLASVSEVDLIG